MTTFTLRTSAEALPPVPPPPPVAKRTLSSLFAKYAAEFFWDKTPATQYSLQLLFAQILRDIGDLPVDKVTPDVLRAWKLQLSQRHKPGTVHNYMKRLSRVLRVAVEEYGWLDAHPMTRVKKPSPGRGRVRFLTSDERTRLLAACRVSGNPHLYAIVQLALWTGGRKSELRRLRWTEVDLDAGVVRFVETKTDEPRTVPLVGDALMLMQQLADTRQPGVPWVFPGPGGRAPRAIESPWVTAVRKAGIPDFHFHDLRHTCASYLAMSGASLLEIADVLGHKSMDMTKRYSHLLHSHTGQVVERMGLKFLPSPTPEGPPDAEL